MKIIYKIIPLFLFFGNIATSQALSKINTEGFRKSQVMSLITDLSDVYGPRLTGTNEYYNAAESAKKTGTNHTNLDALEYVPKGDLKINPNDFADKIYWWTNGQDNLGSNNLIDSGETLSLPYTFDIKKSTEIIALNNWFNGMTPNAINKNAIHKFCASRQFYNKTTNELIIIKSGKHLTQSEEIGLLNYMGITNVVHDYHANSRTLFSRFTNTYTNSEKSRIDNVMRLLLNSGVYNKLDHFYLSATSGKEEQLIDWINPVTNMTIAAKNVAIVPYRGLAPQTGYFSTNANPTNDAKILVDDAFVSIKLLQDFEFNSPNTIFGAIGDANFKYRPYLSGTKSVKSYEVRFFNTNPLYIQLGTSKYSDTHVMTKLSSTFKSFREGALKHTVSVPGTNSMANSVIAIGGIVAANGQSHPSNVQHFAYGKSLTDAEASSLSSIVDNFCYGQQALTLDYIQEDGYKVYTYENDIKDALGEKCIFQKFDGIYASNDLGKTTAAFIPFSYLNLGNIEMCHIFDNDKIVFATNKNKVYTTTFALSSITEITPTKNGKPYVIHTPAKAFYPGEYFKFLGAKNKQYLNDGREIFVWGNYCNVWGGASPVVVWYSFGDEIKVAYEYGQNPYYRDNGTFVSGQTGQLLGDPNATIITRHSHGVQQAKDNKNLFIGLQGDYDRAGYAEYPKPFFESGFIKLVFNPLTESFTVTQELIGSGNSRAKSSAAQMPGDGYLYYSSDLSVTDPIAQLPEIGYFKVKYDEVSDWTKHERFHLHEALTKSLNQFHLDNEYFFMGAGYAAGGQSYGLFGDPDIIYSPDMVTYKERILPIAGNSYFYKIVKISHKKYLLNAMVTYNYQNALTVVLDFN